MDSRHEIERISEALWRSRRNWIFQGAEHALRDEFTPVPSEGAKLDHPEAMSDEKTPLFVTRQGAITDLASAYLMEPADCRPPDRDLNRRGSYPERRRRISTLEMISMRLML